MNPIFSRRSRSLLVPIVLALTSSLASVVACNFYREDLLDAKAPAGEGIGFWSGHVGPDCFSARVPSEADRPPVSRAPSQAPFFLALNSLVLGTDRALDYGFDLDSTCTRSETCDEVQFAPSSCKAAGAVVPVDGRYCRDNAFGRLANTAAQSGQVSASFNLNAARFNCALRLGYSNYLVRVSNYNGLADDDSVRVDLYPSPGIEGPIAFSCDSPEWETAPALPVSQPWKLQDDAIVTPGEGVNVGDARMADANAYVRGNFLVANLPDGSTFSFPGKEGNAVIPINFAKAMFTGYLRRAIDGVYQIDDGILAGRTTPAAVMDSLRRIGACDPAIVAQASQLVGQAVDVLASGKNDVTQTCDALSVAVKFTAVQATPGSRVAVTEPPTCADAGATDAGALDGSVPEVGPADAASADAEFDAGIGDGG